MGWLFAFVPRWVQAAWFVAIGVLIGTAIAAVAWAYFAATEGEPTQPRPEPELLRAP